MSYEDDGAGLFVGIFIIVVFMFVFLALVIPTPKEREEAKAKLVDTVRVVDTVVVKSPAVKVDSTPTDTSKFIGLPSNADLIFYTIPTDKLLEYAVFSTADTIGSGGYSDINRQKKWNWLRKLFNRSFEPYIQDGITYVWCVQEFNSNTITVYNGYWFEMDEKKLLSEYLKYRDNQ
jgi:preprotein translocase subunit YajC